MLEVVNGFRPATHLRPLTDPRRFPQVVEQLQRRAPLRQRRHGPGMATLKRVRTTEPAAGAVEAAVVFEHCGRSWAMALRLELQQPGWRCCVLQVL